MNTMTNTPSGIASSAMLVDLNISVWTARKLDKKVSQEVDATKATKARAGNYHKNLLAGTTTLEQVQKLASEARAFHYTYTLPWSDTGTRLLPAKAFFDYKAKLAELERRFEQAVDTFVKEYDVLVSAAAFTLGALFDRSEYPPAIEVRDKFRFKYVFYPVPVAGDFRIDIESEAKQELQDQYSGYYEAKTREAMQDAWQRLHETLTHISEKLSDGGDKKKRIHESTVSNARELCELLTVLNITADPALERARLRLEEAMLGVQVEVLREDALVRADTKRKVDDIIDLLG